MQFANAHALVVGIAQYEKVNRLPQAVLNDARAMYETLVHPQHCGYAPENVRYLTNEQAARQALLEALDELAKCSTPDATVFIFISSHGGWVKNGPYAGAYLLPVDADCRTSKAMDETAISGEALTQALKKIPARKVVVIFDCCHAGGIGTPKEAKAPEIKAGLPDSYYEALKSGSGRVIMASSRDTEYSYVLPGAENSLFTQQVLAGLRGGVASEDGLVRIFDLFEYVQPRVTGAHPQQHPIFKAEIEDNFAIALARGGQKAAAVAAVPSEEYRYDVYVSYADEGEDAQWVWDTLVPRLEEAGLRAAVSGDSYEPGVAHVVTIERGIHQAKRTVVVLSEAYLSNTMANFENTLAQTMDVREGTYRLLPVKISAFEEQNLPMRLAMLTTLDMTHPYRAGREFERLVQALQGPIPRL